MNRVLDNIIIVYDYATINGGAAKVAIQSAVALSKTKYNVYYFSAVGPVEPYLQNSSVKVTCLGLNDINHGSRLAAIKNGIWNKSVEKEFTHFLREFSPNNTIIHIHGWAKALSSVVVKVADKNGFKTIITLHDYFTLCPNGGFYDYQKQKICEHKPMSPSCVFCNCDKRNYAQKLWRVVRQIVQDKYIRNNSNVAYISISQKNEDIVKAGVKSRIFYMVNNPVQLAKEHIDDCTKSYMFLYVGRLSDEKGIELFCQAITDLKKDYDIKGIVVGDGGLFKEMETNYPLVQFDGWKNTNEVQKYIQKARTLVFPSKCCEGAPLSIIEAMSAGLPCIVSNCTSAIELVHDGVNGYVFDSGNLDSLKEKIICALGDNFGLIEKNVKIKDYLCYSEEAHVKKLIAVYKEWLNQV